MECSGSVRNTTTRGRATESAIFHAGSFSNAGTACDGGGPKVCCPLLVIHSLLVFPSIAARFSSRPMLFPNQNGDGNCRWGRIFRRGQIRAKLQVVRPSPKLNPPNTSSSSVLWPSETRKLRMRRLFFFFQEVRLSYVLYAALYRTTTHYGELLERTWLGMRPRPADCAHVGT